MRSATAPPEFQARFGRPPVYAAEAPGRVNLIGEHTDYNGGRVLPMPIRQKTLVEIACRPDGLVRGRSVTLDEEAEYVIGGETRTGGWIDYVQGVTSVLHAEGRRIGGFDFLVSSEVPPGGGLSSSAALEVALLRALAGAFSLSIDGITTALLAHRVETEFVGASVGVMDQMVASLGAPGHALYLETRSLRHEQVRFHEALEVVVLDSGRRHAHSTGGYNERRRECAEAAERLGAEYLTDLGVEALPRLEGLPATLAKRARHVITENARVLEALAALRAGDGETLGRLFSDSHQSMRDDFEVSIPEIDFLVEAAGAEAGVFGARLTGGGFGGCVLVLARRGEGLAAAQRVRRLFMDKFGELPEAIVP